MNVIFVRELILMRFMLIGTTCVLYTNKDLTLVIIDHIVLIGL